MEVLMKQAVLFDCDGVLVDSEEGLSKIASFVLNRHYDIPAVPEDFTQYIGTGEDSISAVSSGNMTGNIS